MEYSDYFRILRKRWWLIIAAVAVMAGAGLVFARLQRPVYTSTAEIVIEPARPDWGLGQVTKMMLRSYMTVIDSDRYAQEVVDRLGLPMSAEALRSTARFSTEDDRMVIRLEIEGPDGDQANDIARTWGNLMVEWRETQNQLQNKEDRVKAYLRDDPTYAMTWPQTRMLTLAGAILGLVVAGAAIFVLEWTETGVIRTPYEVEQQLQVAVLGAIPPTR